MIENIIQILSSNRFLVNKESVTQQDIERKFIERGIDFKREYFLDKNNKPDFFIDGIAIEVKIKGNAKSIYKQCLRYCMFDEVEQLILVTNRSMGFPKDLNGKPCYFINLGKAWL